MYLSRVRIRNFRSVKDAEIKLVNGKNVLVGRNSVGKSNIFAAIDIVMGEANPTYRNSKVEEGDFYYSYDKDTGEVFQSDEIIILCEMSKFKGEFIDHDSFDEKIHLMPFYGETVNNGRDRQKNLRKVRMSDISGISEIFDIVDNNFNKCWMSPREEKYKSILDSAERIVYVFRAKI